MSFEVTFRFLCARASENGSHIGQDMHFAVVCVGRHKTVYGTVNYVFDLDVENVVAILAVWSKIKHTSG